MGYKVLITTSGKGTRLGEITNFTNKCLVRVGTKPSICHIIDSYPLNTEFVITIGYFGNLVKELIGIYYPKLNVTFVQVDNFDGDGSSLLYSMFQAKQYLKCPFIFHACDTISFDSKPDLNCNWITGFKMNDSTSYASLSVIGENVKSIHNKGYLNFDYIHIGLIGIKDYDAFWNQASNILIENPNNSTLGDVDVISKLIDNFDFKFNEAKSWFDIGSIKGLNNARKKIDNDNIDILDKLAESIFFNKNKVIKFFSDSKINSNRIKRVKYLNGTTPKLIDKTNNFFSYEYTEGKLFSSSANRSNFLDLIKWSEKFLWKKVEIENIKIFKDDCIKFYKEKTTQRIHDFFKKKNINESENIINNEHVPSIFELLEKVDFEYLSDTKPTNFHGDFILDNIIYSDDENKFKLIDWRQDFGGNIEYGDQYYDLGKLAHNLVVNHKIIENNLFDITIKGKEVSVNINRYNSLVDCENIYFDYLSKNNYDINKVKIIRALIWLNMSPLHHHPFDLFLFYFGKYHLKSCIYE